MRIAMYSLTSSAQVRWPNGPPHGWKMQKMAIGSRLVTLLAGHALETSGFGVILYERSSFNRCKAKVSLMCLKELRSYLGFLSVDEITHHVRTGALPEPCNGRRIGEIGAVWDRDAVDLCLAVVSTRKLPSTLKEGVR
jgi:hypothetical protein